MLYYFPWYFAFKTVFVLWLQLPAFRVSSSLSVFLVYMRLRLFPFQLGDCRRRHDLMASPSCRPYLELCAYADVILHLVIQGAQVTYHTVLKPVLANISNKQVSSYSQQPTTNSAPAPAE